MTSPSSSGREKQGDEGLQDVRLEHASRSVDFVDEITERKLLRKVDYRIIPMIMWSLSSPIHVVCCTFANILLSTSTTFWTGSLLEMPDFSTCKKI